MIKPHGFTIFDYFHHDLFVSYPKAMNRTVLYQRLRCFYNSMVFTSEILRNENLVRVVSEVDFRRIHQMFSILVKFHQYLVWSDLVTTINVCHRNLGGTAQHMFIYERRYVRSKRFLAYLRIEFHVCYANRISSPILLKIIYCGIIFLIEITLLLNSSVRVCTFSCSSSFFLCLSSISLDFSSS